MVVAPFSFIKARSLFLLKDTSKLPRFIYRYIKKGGYSLLLSIIQKNNNSFMGKARKPDGYTHFFYCNEMCMKYRQGESK